MLLAFADAIAMLSVPETAFTFAERTLTWPETDPIEALSTPEALVKLFATALI